MPPINLEATLTAVAVRVAGQVAAFGDRVAVDRAPQGAGAWSSADGPFAVVTQTGPAIPVAAGDGATVVEEVRVSVAVWQPADGQPSTVVLDTVAALDGWAPSGEGIAGRVFAAFRVPQEETDLIRTEVEVRYSHHR